ncbi:MAG TPA: hypothetical protein VH814_02690 [Steroidobacteraceae bacterium]
MSDHAAEEKFAGREHQLAQAQGYQPVQIALHRFQKVLPRHAARLARQQEKEVCEQAPASDQLTALFAAMLLPFASLLLLELAQLATLLPFHVLRPQQPEGDQNKSYPVHDRIVPAR